MTTPPDTSRRQRWMATLAKARPAELEAAWTGLADRPGYRVLRNAEPGMVMVRGRAGGTGARFNLGEIVVTRSAVQLDSGTTGHAYVAGHNARHAELAALFDALLQEAGRTVYLETAVIAPLAAAQAERHRIAAVKAAATKVDFFTVVRGED